MFFPRAYIGRHTTSSCLNSHFSCMHSPVEQISQNERFCLAKSLLKTNYLAGGTGTSNTHPEPGGERVNLSLRLFLEGGALLAEAVWMRLRQGKGYGERWNEKLVKTMLCIWAFHMFCCSIKSFQTHILPMSTRKHKHIMVAFLYHMENMTVHISTTVFVKFAFWKRY